MDGTGKIGGGTSGHGDQRTDKNTAPFFSGSGALCKVDSPFSLLCFCMLLLREDTPPIYPSINIYVLRMPFFDITFAKIF